MSTLLRSHTYEHKEILSVKSCCGDAGSGIKGFFDIANTMDGALSLGVRGAGLPDAGACQGGGGRFHPARRDKVY